MILKWQVVQLHEVNSEKRLVVLSLFPRGCRGISVTKQSRELVPEVLGKVAGGVVLGSSPHRLSRSHEERGLSGGQRCWRRCPALEREE